MEVEVGLKITHTRDDITSHSNLQINKNDVGPLFLFTETDSLFFLIAYLKGFKRENINININEDGNRIAISGEKAVQEMVLSGWIMLRKDVELRAFKKVFQIPDGIILDKIKAKFNDENSTLTIIMPKSEKGMRGLQIEEVKEDSNLELNKKTDKIEEAVNKELERRESEIPDVRNEMPKVSENEEEGNKSEGDEETNEELIQVERQKKMKKRETRGSKVCPPLVVAGSAIFVSLVVLVISFIRAKRR